jgi:hypothetical protein
MGRFGRFASEIRLYPAPHRVLLNSLRKRWRLTGDVRANLQTLLECSPDHVLPCGLAFSASASTTATRCRQY